MRPASFDECYPMARSQCRDELTKAIIARSWLVAFSPEEFAIGFELNTGVRAALATQKGTLLRFRQFEGAHTELFSMGVQEFNVNVERWDMDNSYNRFKAQYEVRRRRQTEPMLC